MPLATLDDVSGADRILLHGVTGSGKSTAALRLGSVLGLPVHLVDDEIGWLPGWVERSDDEMRHLAAAMAAESRWVVDSTYGSFRDLVTERAQVVIALDYPRWLSLFRLSRRALHRVVTKEPICNGNTESLRQLFSGDSIVVWHFRSFTRKQETARAWHAAAEGVSVMLLRHPRELERLMTELASSDHSRRRSATRRGGLS